MAGHSQIAAACEELGASTGGVYRPPITFVVVQKRHHTRFFPTDPRYSDRSGNCVPGAHTYGSAASQVACCLRVVLDCFKFAILHYMWHAVGVQAGRVVHHIRQCV